MITQLTCPACRRFLAAAEDFVITICGYCKAEIRYKSQAYRQRVQLDKKAAST